MQLFGLEHIYGLRTLNAIIMFAGVFFSIKKYKQKLGVTFIFLKGGARGLVTSFTAAISFAAFMAVYLFLNDGFMAELKANAPHGVFMNEVGVSMIIFIEAIASGFIFTFISMQRMKARAHSDLVIPNSGYEGHGYKVAHL